MGRKELQIFHFITLETMRAVTAYSKQLMECLSNYGTEVPEGFPHAGSKWEELTKEQKGSVVKDMKTHLKTFGEVNQRQFEDLSGVLPTGDPGKSISHEMSSDSTDDEDKFAKEGSEDSTVSKRGVVFRSKKVI